MANKYRDIDKEELEKYAIEYCEECLHATRENVTHSGRVIGTKDRKIPTIGFFCSHWIRKKDIDFYERQHIYLVQEDKEHPLYDTIKKIRRMFDDLAEDIVANEGKGIFWAKNRLGMTDKVQNDNINREQPLFGDDENK